MSLIKLLKNGIITIGLASVLACSGPEDKNCTYDNQTACSKNEYNQDELYVVESVRPVSGGTEGLDLGIILLDICVPNDAVTKRLEQCIQAQHNHGDGTVRLEDDETRERTTIHLPKVVEGIQKGHICVYATHPNKTDPTKIDTYFLFASGSYRW